MRAKKGNPHIPPSPNIKGGGRMDRNPEEIWKEIKGKKNVVGYSQTPKKRIKGGREVEGTKVIRVYVSKKEPVECLDPEDVIPRTIGGFETDVVEIGEVKAQEAGDDQAFQQKGSSP
ncbi:MAG: hypothetical protein ACTSQ8_15080 [Candidatus Helarchaeota archaeon]